MGVTSLSDLAAGASLVDTNVTGVTHDEERFVELSFDHCAFNDCALRGARFESCEFIDCTFEGCDLSGVSWRASRIAGGQFKACKLLGVDWTQIDWRSASLHGLPSFEGCRLTDGFAEEVAWREIRLVDCELEGFDFTGADLSGASFAGCALLRARFERANLKKADFRGASDYAIDVRTADIAGARFELPAAVGLLESLPIKLE